jgi:hypothetical protein
MNRLAVGLRAGCALVVCLALASSANAYLGSFTPADGYNINLIQPWVDVSYFNSGANGPNAGGGVFGHIPPDSGLWKVAPGAVGGIYNSAANRAAALVGVPPYPAVIPPTGSAPIYIVGDHSPGRTDNSALAFRNDSPAGTGPAQYQYTIDVYDTGGGGGNVGPLPSSVTTGVVTTQFYFCPNPADPPNPGAKPRDKFTMSFVDGSGSVGFQWGYAAQNEVYWRLQATDPWTYTSVIADATNWDGVKVDIDLDAQTFVLDYYDVSTNTWSNMIPVMNLGMSMTNLTRLDWQLEDNVFSGVGGKNFFDDFGFVYGVPEPSSLVLLLVVTLGLVTVQRRNRASN